jgi:hypothetical protein
MFASIKMLLASIVDYAGLFPPAKLDMQQAIATCDRHHQSPYNWMLGRFVLPISRLSEFEALLPEFQLQQWSLSLILSKDWQAEMEKIQSNAKITISSLEFPPLPPIEIEKIIPHLPPGIEAFFEIPLSDNLEAYLATLQNTGAAAKIRTGGITADAFPSVTQLCQTIFSFAEAQISFKATAGLHHPLPGNYRLTYDLNSDRTIMHGFLNVAILAAFIYWQKVTLQQARELLQESSSKNFQFKEDTITWHDNCLSLAEIEQTRQQFFRSFGSCSFQEPLEDLKNLKIL